MATVSDNKSIEGGKKPVCGEATMEGIAGTIFDYFSARVKEEVEVYIQSAEGHKEIIPSEELTEET